MTKTELVENVMDRGLVEVFTHPAFDPEHVTGTDGRERQDLGLIQDLLRTAGTIWQEFVASADEEADFYDCE